MSDAFILRSGGAGISRSSAILHIVAPIGSTITLSKNSIVVKVLGPEKSYVDQDDNTIAHWHHFIGSGGFGVWTIEATREGAVDSDTVEIDSTGRYEVRLGYRLYLYNRGDKCLDVVGAWNAVAWRYNSTSAPAKAPTVTWNSTNVYVTLQNGGGALRSSNKIDLTRYKQLGVVWANANTSGQVFSTIISSSLPTYHSGVYANPQIDLGGSNGASGTKEVDISNVNEECYIMAALGSYSNGTMTARIYEIYLDQKPGGAD